MELEKKWKLVVPDHKKFFLEEALYKMNLKITNYIWRVNR